MQTIKWGIIGVGNVCEIKSGPGLQKAEHSELVVVMRRSGDLARDFAERHSVPKWTDDDDAVINDPEVNAIYIATPPYAHLPLTLNDRQLPAAFEHGVQHDETDKARADQHGPQRFALLGHVERLGGVVEVPHRLHAG